jgi:hypothetical protein
MSERVKTDYILPPLLPLLLLLTKVIVYFFSWKSLSDRPPHAKKAIAYLATALINDRRIIYC